MRKVILAFVLLSLLLLQAVPAAAEEVTRITITASETEVMPGDEVTFTVSIDGGEKCRYYGLMLEYDDSVFEMGSGKCTIAGAMLSTFDPERGFVVLNDKERVPEGTLGTFTMKVREDAAFGDTSVSGFASVKSGDTPKASSVTGAEMTVTPAEDDAPETTAPSQGNPSGSQNQSGSQTTKPSGSQNQSGSQTTKPSGSQNQSGSQTTKPSGSQNQSGSQTTRPSGSQYQSGYQSTRPYNSQSQSGTRQNNTVGMKNTITIPTFSNQLATTPVETTAENAETAETETVPQETAAQDQPEEKEGSLLPVMILGVVIVCSLLAVVVIKKRKA